MHLTPDPTPLSVLKKGRRTLTLNFALLCVSLMLHMIIRPCSGLACVLTRQQMIVQLRSSLVCVLITEQMIAQLHSSPTFVL